VVLVETVGVGQSEVEIAGAADTSVVLVAPGMGDGIQAAKAGILEIGDLYVVNKADREGAATVRRELRSMLALTERAEGDWRPPVLLASAQSGEGIEEFVVQLEEHRSSADATGTLRARRLRRAAAEVETIAVTALRQRWAGVSERSELGVLAERVVDGSLDPYAAADELLRTH
jgi:LAO/AO transport system kinase